MYIEINKIVYQKQKLHTQTSVMSAFIKETDLTTETGFYLAFIIDKSNKSHTEGEFLKYNIKEAVAILDHENKNCKK